VTKVDGRRIEFTVRAVDEREEIGTGTHERVIIELSRMERRLQSKT